MNDDDNNDNNKQILSQLMDGEWQDLDPASSVKTACADDELKATWSRYHLIRDVIRNDAITVDTSLSVSISQAIEDEPAYTNVSAIGSASSSSAIANSAPADESVESAVSTRQSQQNPRYWRTGLSGAALAACVALATVIGLNVWQGAPDSPVNAQTIAATIVPSAAPAAMVSSTAPAAMVSSTAPATMAPAAAPGLVLPEVEYVSNRGTYWVTREAKRSANAEKRLNMLLSTHIESSPTAERTGMLPYSRLVGYDSVASEQ